MSEFTNVDELADSLEDDYYGFLNVPRSATKEEITASFRRLSKVYHPDKHRDSAKKRQAETIFNKIKKAYDVLIDAEKKAIYDTLGLKGLDTEGWTVIERKRSPNEIREEYERLVKEREERRLEQRTNPKGSIIVGINATDLFERLPEKKYPSIEINSMSLHQSIDAPLTINQTATLQGSLVSAKGVGHGNVSAALRHIISPQTWTEVEFGAGQGPLLTLKGFRTISRKIHANAQCLLHFSNRGVRPGCAAVFTQQLDKHLVGSVTWKAGLQSSMATYVVWETEQRRVQTGVQFGLPDSHFITSYTHKYGDTKLKVAVKAGALGLVFEYGCETKISQQSSLGGSVSVGTQTGVLLKVKLTRASQSYVFPISLSEEVVPAAIFYGTLAPLVSFYCLREFVINPYKKREKEREMEKSRSENAERIAEKRREAEGIIELLQESYRRIRAQEEADKGLIVVVAVYGNEAAVEAVARANRDIALGDKIAIEKAAEVFDVTIPLQCLVRDSYLMTPASSKANLPGFYDPCLGETKKLFVRYLYRGRRHEFFCGDEDAVSVPNDEHLMSS